MAQILVPGTAQAVCAGVWGTQPWAVVLHFKWDNSTAVWTPTQMQALADQVNAAWAARLKGHHTVSIVLQSVNTVDLGTATPSIGSNTTAVPGNAAGPQLNSSAMCTVIQKHIASRYRGGHPRSYLPVGTQTDAANEFEWSVAYQAAIGSAFTNFIGDIRTGMGNVGGNQVSEVVPRYTYQYVDDPVHHKYHKQRTGLENTHIVQNYQCNPIFGTQRRRLTQG